MAERPIKNNKMDKSSIQNEKFIVEQKFLDIIKKDSDLLTDLFIKELLTEVELNPREDDLIRDMIYSYFLHIIKPLLELDKLKGDVGAPSGNLVFAYKVAVEAIKDADSKLIGANRKFYSFKEADFNDSWTALLSNMFLYIPRYFIRLAAVDRRYFKDMTFGLTKMIMAEIEKSENPQSTKQIMNSKQILISELFNKRRALIEKGKDLTFQELAREIKKHPNTLYSKLKKYNLKFDVGTGTFSDYKTGKVIDLTKFD
jgi:hypothetical protein